MGASVECQRVDHSYVVPQREEYGGLYNLYFCVHGKIACSKSSLTSILPFSRTTLPTSYCNGPPGRIIQTKGRAMCPSGLVRGMPVPSGALCHRMVGKNEHLLVLLCPCGALVHLCRVGFIAILPPNVSAGTRPSSKSGPFV